MQKTYAFLILICILKLSEAQNTFQKLLGNETYCSWGRGILQTQDKGFICIGTEVNMAGSMDIYLVKTDSHGDTIWTRTYGNDFTEWAGTLIHARDGRYMLCGSTGVQETSDLLILKFDDYGDTIWTASYDISLDDIGTCIVQTNDGGYLIGGMTRSMSDLGDICLISIDSAGKVKWAETFGSNNLDLVTTAIQTNDGGFFLSGTTKNFVPTGFGPMGTFFFKINASGKVLWSYTFSNQNIISCNSTIQTRDGGFIMAGMTTADNNKDAALMKIDSNGQPEWVRSYGIQPFSDEAYSVEETDDGYALTGYTSKGFGSKSNTLLIKTDKSGHIQWSRYYSSLGSNRCMAIIHPSDGGYVLYGESVGFSDGVYQLYLIRTDEKGESGCNDTAFILKERSHDSALFDIKSLPQTVRILAGDSPIKLGYETTFNTLCWQTSISQVQNVIKFLVYPNPAQESLTINYSGDTDVKICLYNAICKLVWTRTFSPNSNAQIDVSQFPKGLYVLIGISDGMEETVQTIVID